MPHEDIIFNGNTFVDNLKLMLQKDSTGGGAGISLTNSQSKLYMDNTFPGKSAAEFLASFTTDGNPLLDWNDFLAKWKAYSGDQTDALLQSFQTDFLNLIDFHISDTGPSIPTIGDWSVIADAGQGPFTDQQVFAFRDQLLPYFQRSFSHFLGSYPYLKEDTDSNPSTPPVPKRIGDTQTAGDNFFTNWLNFMTQTAEIDDGTTTGTAVDMAAYEQIYTSFFPQEPGETAAQASARYAARIQRFYNDALKETGRGNPANGWFIPSHHFHEWFEDLREEFITRNTLSSLDIQTTATPDSAKRILVIDRILRLLIEMIDILQLISASQAARLNFLTIWQQAYTELITDIPSFAPGDGSPLGGSEDKDKAFRASVSNKMQSLLEAVRARRSTVQDEAKAMQTTINQSQDAANQQTQMATSILQQLSTILSQIFR